MKRVKLFSLIGVAGAILVASVAMAAATSGRGNGSSGSPTNANAASTGASGASASGSGGSQHAANTGVASTGAGGGAGAGSSGTGAGASQARPDFKPISVGLFTSGVPSNCGKGNASPCPTPTGPPNGRPKVSPVGSNPPVTTNCGKGSGTPCPVGPNGLPPYPMPMQAPNLAGGSSFVLAAYETTSFTLSGFASGATVALSINGRPEGTAQANALGSVVLSASSDGSGVSLDGGPAVSSASGSYQGTATEGLIAQSFTING